MQMDRRYRREWPCCNGPGGTVGGELPGRHGGVASVVQKQFAALGSICVKLNATKAASVHQRRVLVQPAPVLVAENVSGAKQGAPSVLVHFRQKTRGGCVSYWCGARKAVLRSQRWVWKRGFFSSGLMQRECECRGSAVAGRRHARRKQQGAKRKAKEGESRRSSADGKRRREGSADGKEARVPQARSRNCACSR